MSAGARDAPLTYEGEYDPARTYLPRQLVQVGGTPYLSLAKQSGVAPPAASWLAFDTAAAGAGYGLRYHSWGGQAPSANDGLGSYTLNPVVFASTPDDIQGAGATVVTLDAGDTTFTVREDGIYTVIVNAIVNGLREGMSWFLYLAHSQSFLNIEQTGIGTRDTATAAPSNILEVTIPATRFVVGDVFRVQIGLVGLDPTSPNAFGGNPIIDYAEIIIQRLPAAGASGSTSIDGSILHDGSGGAWLLTVDTTGHLTTTPV